jgi:hypothetical protein
MYFVTWSVAGSPKRGEMPSCDHSGAALLQANALLASGATGVSIRDEEGHYIEGDALALCCRSGRITQNLKPW